MTHWLYSFNLCHKFLIGLQSGDPADVLQQFTLFAVKKSLACLDECLGSLSAMNLWLVGYTSLIKDSNVFRSISVYSNTSMIPSKMQIPVGPLLLIPPQICNLMGCFALYKMKHFLCKYMRYIDEMHTLSHTCLCEHKMITLALVWVLLLAFCSKIFCGFQVGLNIHQSK